MLMMSVVVAESADSHAFFFQVTETNTLTPTVPPADTGIYFVTTSSAALKGAEGGLFDRLKCKYPLYKKMLIPTVRATDTKY